MGDLLKLVDEDDAFYDLRIYIHRFNHQTLPFTCPFTGALKLDL
jgi:hypothetical protein